MLYTIDVNKIKHSRNILAEIGVTPEGIELMADKLLHLNIKIKNIRLPAANILKQEMLSLGADAAVAKGVVVGKDELSDLILAGSLNQFNKLEKKLQRQSWFGLEEIRERIKLIVQSHQTEQKVFLQIRDNMFYSDKCYIMGILNITPDSFSDGNVFFEHNKAVEHCLKMIDDGVDIIDIGGESSRSKSDPIGSKEEMRRILPIIDAIRSKTNIPISVDTYRKETAIAALDAGADMINDISALRFDEFLADSLIERKNIPIVLMHMKGEPKTMQDNPFYEDVIDEIMCFFEERIHYCEQIGIAKERLILDPGIGFGKRLEDNLNIIHNLSAFKSLGCPVLLGASRKAFINQIYQSSPKERLMGTLASTALAIQKGVNFLRVHDVKENREFLQVLSAIEGQV